MSFLDPVEVVAFGFEIDRVHRLEAGKEFLERARVERNFQAAQSADFQVMPADFADFERFAIFPTLPYEAEIDWANGYVLVMTRPLATWRA